MEDREVEKDTRKLPGRRERPKQIRKCFTKWKDSDVDSLKTQLYIWFPCLFTKPSFEYIQRAFNEMTLRVFPSVNILEQNPELSYTKLQRERFRKIHRANIESHYTKSKVNLFDNNGFEERKMLYDKRSGVDLRKRKDYAYDLYNNINADASKDTENNDQHILSSITTANHEEIEVNDKKCILTHIYDRQRFSIPSWFIKVLENETIINLHPFNVHNSSFNTQELQELSKNKRRIRIKMLEMKASIVITIIEEQKDKDPEPYDNSTAYIRIKTIEKAKQLDKNELSIQDKKRKEKIYEKSSQNVTNSFDRIEKESLTEESEPIALRFRWCSMKKQKPVKEKRYLSVLQKRTKQIMNNLKGTSMRGVESSPSNNSIDDSINDNSGPNFKKRRRRKRSKKKKRSKINRNEVPLLSRYLTKTSGFSMMYDIMLQKSKRKLQSQKRKADTAKEKAPKRYSVFSFLQSLEKKSEEIDIKVEKPDKPIRKKKKKSDTISVFKMYPLGFETKLDEESNTCNSSLPCGQVNKSSNVNSFSIDKVTKPKLVTPVMKKGSVPIFCTSEAALCQDIHSVMNRFKNLQANKAPRGSVVNSKYNRKGSSSLNINAPDPRSSISQFVREIWKYGDAPSFSDFKEHAYKCGTQKCNVVHITSGLILTSSLACPEKCKIKPCNSSHSLRKNSKKVVIKKRSSSLYESLDRSCESLAHLSEKEIKRVTKKSKYRKGNSISYFNDITMNDKYEVSPNLAKQKSDNQVHTTPQESNISQNKHISKADSKTKSSNVKSKETTKIDANQSPLAWIRFKSPEKERNFDEYVCKKRKSRAEERKPPQTPRTVITKSYSPSKTKNKQCPKNILKSFNKNLNYDYCPWNSSHNLSLCRLSKTNNNEKPLPDTPTSELTDQLDPMQERPFNVKINDEKTVSSNPTRRSSKSTPISSITASDEAVNTGDVGTEVPKRKTSQMFETILNTLSTINNSVAEVKGHFEKKDDVPEIKKSCIPEYLKITTKKGYNSVRDGSDNCKSDILCKPKRCIDRPYCYNYCDELDSKSSYAQDIKKCTPYCSPVIKCPRNKYRDMLCKDSDTDCCSTRLCNKPYVPCSPMHRCLVLDKCRNKLLMTNCYTENDCSKLNKTCCKLSKVCDCAPVKCSSKYECQPKRPYRPLCSPCEPKSNDFCCETTKKCYPIFCDKTGCYEKTTDSEADTSINPMLKFMKNINKSSTDLDTCPVKTKKCPYEKEKTNCCPNCPFKQYLCELNNSLLKISDSCPNNKQKEQNKVKLEEVKPMLRFVECLLKDLADHGICPEKKPCNYEKEKWEKANCSSDCPFKEYLHELNNSLLKINKQCLDEKENEQKIKMEEQKDDAKACVSLTFVKSNTKLATSKISSPCAMKVFFSDNECEICPNETKVTCSSCPVKKKYPCEMSIEYCQCKTCRKVKSSTCEQKDSSDFDDIVSDCLCKSKCKKQTCAAENTCRSDKNCQCIKCRTKMICIEKENENPKKCEFCPTCKRNVDCYMCVKSSPPSCKKCISNHERSSCEFSKPANSCNLCVKTCESRQCMKQKCSKMTCPYSCKSCSEQKDLKDTSSCILTPKTCCSICSKSPRTCSNSHKTCCQSKYKTMEKPKECMKNDTYSGNIQSNAINSEEDFDCKNKKLQIGKPMVRGNIGTVVGSSIMSTTVSSGGSTPAKNDQKCIVSRTKCPRNKKNQFQRTSESNISDNQRMLSHFDSSCSNVLSRSNNQTADLGVPLGASVYMNKINMKENSFTECVETKNPSLHKSVLSKESKPSQIHCIHESSQKQAEHNCTVDKMEEIYCRHGRTEFPKSPTLRIEYKRKRFPNSTEQCLVNNLEMNAATLKASLKEQIENLIKKSREVTSDVKKIGIKMPVVHTCKNNNSRSIEMSGNSSKDHNDESILNTSTKTIEAKIYLASDTEVKIQTTDNKQNITKETEQKKYCDQNKEKISCFSELWQKERLNTSSMVDATQHKQTMENPHGKMNSKRGFGLASYWKNSWSQGTVGCSTVGRHDYLSFPKEVEPSKQVSPENNCNDKSKHITNDVNQSRRSELENNSRHSEEIKKDNCVLKSRYNKQTRGKGKYRVGLKDSKTSSIGIDDIPFDYFPDDGSNVKLNRSRKINVSDFNNGPLSSKRSGRKICTGELFSNKVFPVNQNCIEHLFNIPSRSSVISSDREITPTCHRENIKTFHNGDVYLQDDLKTKQSHHNSVDNKIREPVNFKRQDIYDLNSKLSGFNKNSATREGSEQRSARLRRLIEKQKESMKNSLQKTVIGLWNSPKIKNETSKQSGTLVLSSAKAKRPNENVKFRNDSVEKCLSNSVTIDKSKYKETSNSNKPKKPTKAFEKKIKPEIPIEENNNQINLGQNTDKNGHLLHSGKTKTKTICSKKSETQENNKFIVDNIDNLLSLNKVDEDNTTKWRPRYFGTAEVVEANDYRVVVDGAFTYRNERERHRDTSTDSSMDKNSLQSYENGVFEGECKSGLLDSKDLVVIPNRIVLFKNQGSGDTMLYGSYMRKLSLVDSIIKWKISSVKNV